MFDRIKMAWAVLMGQWVFDDVNDADDWQDEEDTELFEDEEEDVQPAEPPSPLGPLRFITCDAFSEDARAIVRPVDFDLEPMVALMVRQREDDDEVEAQVFLYPQSARAFAAGILNAADECDGTTPLLFVTSGRPGTSAPADIDRPDEEAA